jgi:hypothetical protein
MYPSVLASDPFSAYGNHTDIDLFPTFIFPNGTSLAFVEMGNVRHYPSHGPGEQDVVFLYEYPDWCDKFDNGTLVLTLYIVITMKISVFLVGS